MAELLRAELADPNISIAHFGAIRGLDGWKDFDTVIVAGREQPPPLEVENMARCLFGADAERLLLTGEFVPQMRGHNIKDGTRTAVMVQVHPDLRVQALVEQIREREVEQMVGRLRLPHRTTPARVFLLSNLPTSLLVDRLAPWAEVIPGKLERAIVAGRGVLPLSYFELARVYPSLWATAQDCKDWHRRKGGQVPIRVLYWNLPPLSEATLVSYRRPGHRRGSPHQALLPGRIACTEPARELLASVVGEVEQIRILDVILRPGVSEAPPDVLPEPFVLPTLTAPEHAVVSDVFVFGRHRLVVEVIAPWRGSPQWEAAAA